MGLGLSFAFLLTGLGAGKGFSSTDYPVLKDFSCPVFTSDMILNLIKGKKERDVLVFPIPGGKSKIYEGEVIYITDQRFFEIASVPPSLLNHSSINDVKTETEYRGKFRVPVCTISYRHLINTYKISLMDATIFHVKSEKLKEQERQLSLLQKQRAETNAASKVQTDKSLDVQMKEIMDLIDANKSRIVTELRNIRDEL